MRRPKLIHFIAIKTTETLSIKASVNICENFPNPGKKEKFTPRFPIQGIRLLRAKNFIMKIVGLDRKKNEIYSKSFESDSFGNFYFKIPLSKITLNIKTIKTYEVASHPSLEIFLGGHTPITITSPKRIAICDFDKTLVETKWAGIKEVYHSLVKPLNNFPTLKKSVIILKGHIKKGFYPFILSASPHFYEDAIRDWLYQHDIPATGIFLKDYRQLLSPFEGRLTTKDLKIQGSYKLGQLLDILLLTGIPDELVLMGDNFESDPLIYLTLATLLRSDQGPWDVWNTFKEQKNFRPNKKQNSLFLDKIYQLNSLVESRKAIKKKDIILKIHIRKKSSKDSIAVPEKFAEQRELINLYEAS